MSKLESFLSGTMDITTFLELLKTDDIEIKKEVNSLVPQNAVNCPEHEIWKSFSYDALRITGFDLEKHIKSICRLNGTLEDNLNLFGVLKIFYGYSNPSFVFTKQYEEKYSLYLDVIQDCFDGPEVERTVEKILNRYVAIKSKKERLKEARNAVKLAFHCENKTRPRWIQGPEWPMGEKTPMRFVKQKREDERVQYFFTDVDTDTTRIIEQYY